MPIFFDNEDPTYETEAEPMSNWRYQNEREGMNIDEIGRWGDPYEQGFILYYEDGDTGWMPTERFLNLHTEK